MPTAPWPHTWAPWVGPEWLGVPLVRMILPLSIPSLAALVGAGGCAWGGVLGQGCSTGSLLCSHLHYQAKRPPPRRRETSGLTMTCTVPLPIPNTPLDLLGFPSSGESPASVGAALSGAGAPLPYPSMPPGRGGVTPAHSRNLGLGDPSCKGSGSARP